MYVFLKDSLQSTREVKAEGLYGANRKSTYRGAHRTLAIGCWIVGFFLAICGRKHFRMGANRYRDRAQRFVWLMTEG
jgi:hypothetical protein